MKTRQTTIAVLVILLVMGGLAAGTTELSAQSIVWDVIGAGGGISDGNGNHAISATIGQPIVGPTAANLSTIQQGFWLPINRTSAVAERWENEATTVLTNYPNPFASTTTISFRLPASGQVRIRVLDLMGREVGTIANQVMEAGNHTITWNAHDAANQPIATGHYLCQLEFQPTTSLTGGAIRWTRIMQVRE